MYISECYCPGGGGCDHKCGKNGGSTEAVSITCIYIGRFCTIIDGFVLAVFGRVLVGIIAKVIYLKVLYVDVCKTSTSFDKFKLLHFIQSVLKTLKNFLIFS